jgi:hypothetical protein
MRVFRDAYKNTFIMKNLTVAFLFLFSVIGNAQTSADAAVQISVAVQASPAQIILNWQGNSSSSQYQVFRKLKSATSWGSAIATVNGTVNQYTDNAVSLGTNYEYRVVRVASGYTGYGYVNCGIEVPEIGYRGKLILVVDSTFISSLAPELKRLADDMEGDGWEVNRLAVSRSASVLHVKSLIKAEYQTDSVNTKCVFLFGHVPVPYSGNMNPDGHPDHQGAWPADVFYGEMNGTWTDGLTGATTSGIPARTKNLPGDEKFDQSIVPGEVELQVGRVDLRGLTSFTASTEQQLLKNYLDKDHEYRKKIYVPLQRAVIDDNFGFFGTEAFAASGYKNFGPLVGYGNVTASDYMTTMTGNSYKWSYGCGGGYYFSASGIGTTDTFAVKNLQGVFTMLFGSYFGDWDTTNAFLRAPLAQGRVLTSCWSGRPHYQFHHMGLGENIGYGLLITQNNPGSLYFGSPTAITGKWVHNALMGDPTLRNDVVAPVSHVIATKSGNDCIITWSISPDVNIAGYNIFMKNDTNNSYVKINSALVTATTYTDYCLLYKGIYKYMVRAVKLENTPSGSYYNMSEGIADTALNNNDFITFAGFTYTVNGTTVSFTHTSNISASYYWTFDDGQFSSAPNPTVAYTSNNTFNVMMIATHDCYTDTAYATITINTYGVGEEHLSAVQVFPNPVRDELFFRGVSGDLKYSIINAEGRLIKLGDIKIADKISLTAIAPGIYLVRISDGVYQRAFKIVKE